MPVCLSTGNFEPLFRIVRRTCLDQHVLYTGEQGDVLNNYACRKVGIILVGLISAPWQQSVCSEPKPSSAKGDGVKAALRHPAILGLALGTEQHRCSISGFRRFCRNSHTINTSYRRDHLLQSSAGVASHGRIDRWRRFDFFWRYFCAESTLRQLGLLLTLGDWSSSSF